MNRNFGDRYHLIDKKALEEKRLEKESFQEFITTSGIIDIGKKYNIVSIIGSQSTGKSTLLNKIFGTKFDVQDRSRSVGQTTVGIWVSKDIENNVIVLDVEGSDSVERKSGENMVENQTALMALAMSHCFIINVFLNALGQHTSCQLSIIKIIMQQNLKLFQQDSVKHIVFVVRDWEEDANYEEASRRLNEYLLNIWKEIPKPDQFQNTDFHELFKVQVFTLVYFKMKKEFDEQTTELHAKLAKETHPHFLFQGFDYEKNLRWTDMPQYLSNIWELIANNKDLNLPNEKILISNMRCQQIKTEALEKVKQSHEDLYNKVKQGSVENFGQECVAIMQNALRIYDKDARDYHADVCKEKAKELQDELISRFYTYFQKQVEQLKQTFTQNLQAEFEKLEKQSIYDLPDSLFELDGFKVQFENAVRASIIQQDLWQEQDLIRLFNAHIDSQVKSFVDVQLATFKQQLGNIIKSECDKIVSKQVTTITPNFWKQIDADYYLMLSEKKDKYEQLLNGLRVSDRQIESYLEKFEDDSFQNLKQVIAVASGRFKDQLFQQFKQKFIRTPEGQPRNWQKMTEEEIFHTYTEARDTVFSLLEILRVRQVKFIKLYATVKAKSKTVLITANSQRAQKQSFTIGSDLDTDDIVLNEVFYTQVKSQLSEDIDVQYQDAIQKHKQDFLQNIPKPFWFLLLFFMYDDVLRWMGNPLLLYPILIILCFVGFCIAIGLHSLPKVAFQQVMKHINSLVGPLLFGGLSKLKRS